MVGTSTSTMQPPPVPSKALEPKQEPSAGTAPKKKDEKPAGGGSRQSFSCAECRRLKLKCSRVWPCTSCEKRGCAQICPNGEMKTGKGKRLILADTEELHQRISQLELALAQSHSKHSTAPHPLLSSAYLFASRDAPTYRPYPATHPKMEDDDDMVDSAFGTLTIGTEGQARFVGSFAGSEYLRDAGSDQEDDEEPPAGAEAEVVFATPPTTAASANYPHPGDGAAERASRPAYAEAGIALADSLIAGGPGSIWDIRQLRNQLPRWELEGRQLVQSYWDNVNWMYQIVPRPMFDSDYLINAYDPDIQPNPHKLACVFLVMAVGVMFDLNRQPFDPRGEQLFALGRACLNVMGLEQSSPATVQALHLCGTFILNDKHGNGAEVFWPILGAAMKVAQSLGLHRDGAAFGLSAMEVEERRLVWWEILTYDRLQAMCFGRPYAVSNRMIDTKYPGENELVADKDGYHRSKFKLMGLMEKVIDIQTQTTPVPYAVILQMDKELVDFKKALPDSLLPNVQVQDLPLDRLIHPHLVIHRLGMRLLITQSRLLLSRPSFTRALKEDPADPSHSKHGAAFVALYESAQEIVQLVKQLVIYHPSLTARWWFFWFHAFSSAVCLSAIAIRAPNCAFAAPAFTGMTAVVDISHAAREGCRAKKGLPILIRLRKRALDSMQAASAAPNRTDFRPKSSAASQPSIAGAAAATASKEDDDLTHLAGEAKLRRLGTSPPPRRASFATTPPSVGQSPSSSPLASITEQVQSNPLRPDGGAAGGTRTTSFSHPRGPAHTSPDGVATNNSPNPSIATSATLADRTGYEGAVPSFPPAGMSISGPAGLSPQSPGLWLGAGSSMSPFTSTSLGGMSWGTDAPFSPHNALASGSASGGTHQLEWDRLDLGMNMGNMDMDIGMALGLDRAGYEAFEDSQGYQSHSSQLMPGQPQTGEGVDFDFDALLDGMGGFGYDATTMR